MVHRLVQDPTVRPPTPRQRCRAVRTVAHHAHDAAELAKLLDMLGLSPEEGLRAP
jgi:hypothetical protein